jgi:signal transduction histidine kinase
MDQLKDDVISYLRGKKTAILERWNKKAMHPSGQPASGRLGTNSKGRFILKVALHGLSLSNSELEHYLQANACKLAKIHIKNQWNIEIIVYNVNIVKNMLFQELSHYPSKSKDAEKIFFKLFYIIDRFTYHLIAYYSELKKQMNEKNRHIHSSHEDRLSLLGQMTSSFVHEFRNPLTTVQGFVQLLRAEYPELPYMDIIAAELDQLKFRITQFLMLSKREVVDQEKVIFSLNDLLEQISAFVYPRLLELNVTLQKEMEQDLYVKGIQEEIRQVIINIIFNAIEVMATKDKEAAIHIKGYRNGDKIVLETSNTGPKIPDNLIKTIFEPFVTTKKTGTGLGLYVSKEIIEKHNGSLFCESNDDWTTFTIILNTCNEKEKNGK